jgi:hypothetical protein
MAGIRSFASGVAGKAKTHDNIATSQSWSPEAIISGGVECDCNPLALNQLVASRNPLVGRTDVKSC